MTTLRVRSRALGGAVLVVLAAPTAPLLAQAPADGWCGTRVDPEHLRWREKRFQDGGIVRLPGIGLAAENDFLWTRVALHIVRRNDGTGGVSLNNIAAALDLSNLRYDPAKIVFYVRSVDFINNTAFYEGIDTQAEIDTLRATNHVPNAINIYFVQALSVEVIGSLCGQATFPPSTNGIVMNNNCTGPSESTLPHEIGHYFNLYHTHETLYNVPCGETTSEDRKYFGDGICDTPPDPGLHTCSNPTSPGSCVDAGCNYTGPSACEDIPNYFTNPPTHNIMSYSRQDCRTEFTPGQYDVLRSIADDDRIDHVEAMSPCPSIVYVDGTNPAAGDGTWINPYQQLSAGLTAAYRCAPNRALVSIRNGSYTLAGNPIVLGRPVTLTARNGIASIHP